FRSGGGRLLRFVGLRGGRKQEHRRENEMWEFHDLILPRKRGRKPGLSVWPRSRWPDFRRRHRPSKTVVIPSSFSHRSPVKQRPGNGQVTPNGVQLRRESPRRRDALADRQNFCPAVSTLTTCPVERLRFQAVVDGPFVAPTKRGARRVALNCTRRVR